jgi:phosphate/sulfate permease
MMTFAQILILQIIAHLLADYTFQSHDMAKDKLESGFQSKKLKWHILIVFILSWILSFQWGFVVASALIASLHWVIDGLKKILASKTQLAKYAFFIDQTLHLLVIIGSVFLFVHFFDVQPIIQLPINTHELLIFLGFLLCTKPANIFIGEVLRVYNIQFSDSDSIQNAGKLIGNCERIISLALILNGQFEAVGFILAGKSILRYKESETPKTEYVLIGTLLSFGIAIIIGIAIPFLNKYLS